MTDDIMTRVREWLASCVRVATENGVPEEADLEAAALAFIDGEPARRAAAVAAAREEQREADARFCPNCLGVGFVERPVPCPYCDDSTHDHYCPTGTQRQQCGCGAERIRNTPLAATPLADEIAALRARVAEAVAERNIALEDGARSCQRAEKAEAEREAYWLEREAKWIAERDLYADGSKFHADRAEKAEAERDSLKAQVEELELREECSVDGSAKCGADECNWCHACMARAYRQESLESRAAAAREEKANIDAADLRATCAMLRAQVEARYGVELFARALAEAEPLPSGYVRLCGHVMHLREIHALCRTAVRAMDEAKHG